VVDLEQVSEYQLRNALWEKMYGRTALGGVSEQKVWAEMARRGYTDTGWLGYSDADKEKLRAMIIATARKSKQGAKVEKRPAEWERCRNVQELLRYLAEATGFAVYLVDPKPGYPAMVHIESPSGNEFFVAVDGFVQRK